jgi:hypothetical protein
MDTLLPGITAQRVPTSCLTVNVLSVAGRTVISPTAEPPPWSQAPLGLQRLRWVASIRRMPAVSRSLYRSRIAYRSLRSSGVL